MTTPLFPSVIGHNVLDGGTDAQDGNNYPGPLLQDYAAAVVGAAGLAPRGQTVALFGDSFLQYHNFFWFGSSSVTSMSRSSGVVTVGVTAHGMQTGRHIRVLNAGGFDYAGQITRIDANSFSYPSAGANGNADRSAVSVIDREFVSNQSAFLWANALLGGRLRLTHSFAIGGQTTAALLARIDEALDCDASMIITLAGYNDIGVLTPAESISNTRDIAARIAAVGKTCVYVTQPPLSSSGPKFSAANVDHVLQLNRAIRNLPAEHPSVVVADAFRLMVDKNNTTNRGAALSTMHDGDFVHPSARGAFAIGRSIFVAVDDLIPSINWAGATCAAEMAAAGVSNYNAIDNAPTAATGGTVTSPATGTAGAGITVERGAGSTGACVASVVTDADGTRFQVMAVTPGGSETWQARSNTGGVILTRLTAGERRRLSMIVRVSGLAAGHTLQSLLPFVAITADSVAYYHYLSRSGTVFPIDADGDYTYISEPITIPQGTITNAGWTVQAVFSGTFASAINVAVGDIAWIETDDLPV